MHSVTVLPRGMQCPDDPITCKANGGTQSVERFGSRSDRYFVFPDLGRQKMTAIATSMERGKTNQLNYAPRPAQRLISTNIYVYFHLSVSVTQ